MGRVSTQRFQPFFYLINSARRATEHSERTSDVRNRFATITPLLAPFWKVTDLLSARRNRNTLAPHRAVELLMSHALSLLFGHLLRKSWICQNLSLTETPMIQARLARVPMDCP